MDAQTRTRDSVLIKKALAREPGGATRIHGRYRRFVQAILSRMVNDPDVSEELAQEAFLRAFRHLGKLESASRFPSWLAQIARRVVLDFRSVLAGRPREVTLAHEGLLEAMASSQAGPEEQLLDQGARDLIGGLPEPFRTTLLARYVEDLPLAEVALKQGIDIPLAKYRVRRGLELLRRQLESSAEDPRPIR